MEQIDKALEGIRLGAYFYVPKKSDPSDVASLVHKAILERHRELVQESGFEQTCLKNCQAIIRKCGKWWRLFEKWHPQIALF
jgi:DNA-binding NtrC family response regulator